MARALINVPKTVKKGEAFEIKVLISHPMESGQRRDATGRPIPRHIINRFTCTYGGESVLDVSHLREYTDLAAFRALVAESGLEIVALERTLLWFPLLDPLLFRIGGRLPGVARRPRLLRVLRAVRVPILGYYALEVVLERPLTT